MGWLFGWHSKRELIRDLKKDFNWDNKKSGVSNKVISSCVRGNVLWMLCEQTKYLNVGLHLGELGKENWIACILLEGNKENGWGYKDMEESIHPFYYSCPLSYLDKAPVKNEIWRELVRLYHKDRTSENKIEIGDIIVFRERYSTPEEVKIISIRPLRARGVHSGRVYRIPRRAVLKTKKVCQSKEKSSV